ncbi:hypothetical protein [Mesorhizobium sp.]|uniref:hypothetical protein n=1 Tax=Mesorhizobium sp. TaxID=1871066 RepID=UPI0025CBFDEC|nr:hypothetical protein [Mesorhizobium sp.]
MNATDYLNRSALCRKLVYGPYREFARVYATKMSNEGLGRQCTWRSLSLFRDLMDWHVGSGHAPQDLSEVYVDHFLEHRFKHWSPDTGVGRNEKLTAARHDDCRSSSLSWKPAAPRPSRLTWQWSGSPQWADSRVGPSAWLMFAALHSTSLISIL